MSAVASPEQGGGKDDQLTMTQPMTAVLICFCDEGTCTNKASTSLSLPPPPPFLQCVAALLERDEFLQRLREYVTQLRPPRHYSAMRHWHRPRFHAQREVHKVLRSLLRLIQLRYRSMKQSELSHGFVASTFQKMMVDSLLPAVKAVVMKWTASKSGDATTQPLIDPTHRRDARSKRHRVAWLWHREVLDGKEEEEIQRQSTVDMRRTRQRESDALVRRVLGGRGRGRGGSRNAHSWTGPPPADTETTEASSTPPSTRHSVHSIFYHSVTQVRQLKQKLSETTDTTTTATGGRGRGRGRGMPVIPWAQKLSGSRHRYIIRPFLLKRMRKRPFANAAPPRSSCDDDDGSAKKGRIAEEILTELATRGEGDRDVIRNIGQLVTLLGAVCAATNSATRSQLHQLSPIWTALERLIRDTAHQPETAKESLALMIQFPMIVDDTDLALTADRNDREYLERSASLPPAEVRYAHMQFECPELAFDVSPDWNSNLAVTKETAALLRFMEMQVLFLRSPPHPRPWQLYPVPLRKMMERAEAVVLRLFDTSPRSASRHCCFNPAKKLSKSQTSSSPTLECSALRERMIVSSASAFVHSCIQAVEVPSAAVHNLAQRLLDPLIPLSPSRREELDRLLPLYLEGLLKPAMDEDPESATLSQRRTASSMLFYNGSLAGSTRDSRRQGEIDRSVRIVCKALEVLKDAGAEEEERRKSLHKEVLDLVDQNLEVAKGGRLAQFHEAKRQLLLIKL